MRRIINKNINSILLVDDSSTNNLLFKAILEEHGLSSLTANNAKQAFRLLSCKKISLILLDIMMPVIDGLEFLRVLRKNPSTMEIPVIIVSARDDDDLIEVAKGLNVFDYLIKPVRPNEFIKKIHHALQNIPKKSISEKKKTIVQ